MRWKKKLPPFVWSKFVRESLFYAPRRRQWDGRWRQRPGGPTIYIMARTERWPRSV